MFKATDLLLKTTSGPKYCECTVKDTSSTGQDLYVYYIYKGEECSTMSLESVTFIYDIGKDIRISNSVMDYTATYDKGNTYSQMPVASNVTIPAKHPTYGDNLIYVSCTLICSRLCCVPWFVNIGTPSGNVSAEDIKLSDTILSYNESTKSIVETPVTFIGTPTRDEMIIVNSNNGNLFFTPNHAIYTNEGWASYNPNICASVKNPIQLSNNQKLLTLNGEFDSIRKVEYTKFTEGKQFYNFDTKYHNYFANGVLVHV